MVKNSSESVSPSSPFPLPPAQDLPSESGVDPVAQVLAQRRAKRVARVGCRAMNMCAVDIHSSTISEHVHRDQATHVITHTCTTKRKHQIRLKRRKSLARAEGITHSATDHEAADKRNCSQTYARRQPGLPGSTDVWFLFAVVESRWLASQCDVEPFPELWNRCPVCAWPPPSSRLPCARQALQAAASQLFQQSRCRHRAPAAVAAEVILTLCSVDDAMAALEMQTQRPSSTVPRPVLRT